MLNGTNQTNLNGSSFYLESVIDIISIFQCTCGVIVNALLLHVIWKYVWTPHNQLIFSLAIGDLAIGLMIPALITSILFRENQQQHQWDISCRIIGSIGNLVLNVNTLSHAVVACEQFYVVYCPLESRRHITMKKMQIAGGGIWILSVVGASLMMLKGPRTNPNEKYIWKCSPAYLMQINYIFYRELIPLIICSLLILVLYVSIACIIGRRKAPGDNKRLSLQTRTIVIMFASMFSYFALFWPVVLTSYFKTPKIVMNVVVAIGSTNVIVKPLIYSCLHSFRSAYIKVICCCEKY